MFSSVFVDAQILNHLKDMCKSKKKAFYIPAGMEFFSFDKTPYLKMGFETVKRFDISYDYDESKLDDLLSADLIHIGGGNTFLLRYLLKKRGLIPKLRQFVENGGVLIGNSAGSIVMCEDIQIANIADKNITGIKEYDSIGLVDFYFKPHFQNYYNDIGFFELYSEIRKKVIYGVPDSAAIIIKNGKIIEVGDVVRIDESGEKE